MPLLSADRIQQSALPDRQQTLLLKAALGEGSEALAHWAEWRKTGDIDHLDAGSYRLLPLVFHTFKRSGYRDPDLRRLQGIYRFHWCQNQLLLNTQKDLVQALRQIGIEVLLLKGSALIYRYYGDPGLRPMSDFDILAPRDKVQDAIALLQQQGWTLKIALDFNDPGWQRIRHSVELMNAAGTECDLHWTPLHNATWDGAETPFWQNAMRLEARGASLLIPGPTEQLLHTCLHGGRYNPVPPIRWIADALFILRKDAQAIDWNRLLNLADSYLSMALLKSTLLYLHQEFAAPVPAPVLEQLRNRPLSRLERLEHRLLTRRIAPHRIDQVLLLDWLSHSKSLPGKGMLYRLARFPDYLRHAWALQRWHQLPGFIGKRLLVRFGLADGARR